MSRKKPVLKNNKKKKHWRSANGVAVIFVLSEAFAQKQRDCLKSVGGEAVVKEGESGEKEKKKEEKEKKQRRRRTRSEGKDKGEGKVKVRAKAKASS